MTQSARNAEPEPVYACDMSALTPEEREAHGAVVARLVAVASDIIATASGVTIRLPPEPGMLRLAAEFVARESRCCPFLTFTIDLAPLSASLSLRLEGDAAARAVIQSELGALFDARRLHAGADHADLPAR